MKKISFIIFLMALTAIFVYGEYAHARQHMGQSEARDKMMDMETMDTCSCGCGKEGCACQMDGGGSGCGAAGCGDGMKGMCGAGGCGCGGACGVPGCSCKAGTPSVERIIMKHRDPIKRAFLDETKNLRKELLLKRFEFFEAVRNPETPAETILKLKSEMEVLQIKINQFWLK